MASIGTYKSPYSLPESLMGDVGSPTTPGYLEQSGVVNLGGSLNLLAWNNILANLIFLVGLIDEMKLIIRAYGDIRTRWREVKF